MEITVKHSSLALGAHIRIENQGWHVHTEPKTVGKTIPTKYREPRWWTEIFFEVPGTYRSTKFSLPSGLAFQTLDIHKH